MNVTDMISKDSEREQALTLSVCPVCGRFLLALAGIMVGRDVRLEGVSAWFYPRLTTDCLWGLDKPVNQRGFLSTQSLDCLFCTSEMMGLGSALELSGALGGSRVEWLQHSLGSQAELLEGSQHHRSNARGPWPSH